MNEVLKAKRYLAESSAKIIDVKNVLRTSNPPSALELCSEAIKLALKASLTLFGIPSERDLRSAITDNKEKFPSWFISKLEKILPVKEMPKETSDCVRRAEELNDLVWKLIKKVDEA